MIMKKYRCSFCGDSDEQVDKIFAKDIDDPNTVCICDRCVDEVHKMLTGLRQKQSAKLNWPCGSMGEETDI